MQNRAKGFVFHKTRIFRQTNRNRRLNKRGVVTLIAKFGDAATGHEFAAVFFDRIQKFFHFVTVAMADQGADVEPIVVFIADDDVICDLGHALEEFVIARAMHIGALGAETDLAAVKEGRPRGALDDFVHIRVFEHQRRVLTAQFQRYAAHAICSDFHDRCAGAGFACEGDGIDLRVGGQEGPCAANTKAVHQREGAVWDVGFCDDFGQNGGRAWGFFRWFQNNRVPHHEARRDLHRGHKQRHVPGADRCDHTLWTAGCVPQTLKAHLALKGLGAVFQRHGQIRIGAEQVGRPRTVKVTRLPIAAPCVSHIGLDQIINAFQQAIREIMNDRKALLQRHVAPFIRPRTNRNFSAFGNSLIHHLLRGFVHGRNDFAVERAALFKSLLRPDPFSSDQVLQFFGHWYFPLREMLGPGSTFDGVEHGLA